SKCGVSCTPATYRKARCVASCTLTTLRKLISVASCPPATYRKSKCGVSCSLTTPRNQELTTKNTKLLTKFGVFPVLYLNLNSRMLFHESLKFNTCLFPSFQRIGLTLVCLNQFFIQIS